MALLKGKLSEDLSIIKSHSVYFSYWQQMDQITFIGILTAFPGSPAGPGFP